MPPPFFPDPAFGWLFYGLLVVCCLSLVVSDLKTQRLPNYLTMPTLLLGLVMNIIRVGWLGANGEPGWFFGWTGTVGGILDGLSFSIAGLALAFAMFTILWQLNKCGAGDVKMMTALGAWTGPLWFLFVFAGTIVAVIPILLFWWGYAFAKKKNPGLKLSFALPATISVALLTLWLWRKWL